jgi:hypothetical protein
MSRVPSHMAMHRLQADRTSAHCCCCRSPPPLQRKRPDSPGARVPPHPPDPLGLRQSGGVRRGYHVSVHPMWISRHSQIACLDSSMPRAHMLGYGLCTPSGSREKKTASRARWPSGRSPYDRPHMEAGLGPAGWAGPCLAPPLSDDGWRPLHSRAKAHFSPRPAMPSCNGSWSYWHKLSPRPWTSTRPGLSMATGVASGSDPKCCRPLRSRIQRRPSTS